MNDQVNEFCFASVIGMLGWFFGGLDGYVSVLLVFTVIDYITGICAAGVQGKISSLVGFKGIARKCTMFLFVGLANIIDVHILRQPDHFKIVTCLFYIGNEGISIIENADVLEVPIPKFLRGKFLAFAKKQIKDNDDDNDKN